jgi:hypothetical protein
MNAAKAWVAGAVAFLTSLLTEWQGGQDALQPRDLVVAALGFAVAFATVYATPNRAR